MGDYPKLILEDLVKLFGDAIAIDKINLKVEEGKLVSFLGPSGCGKTTTLRMIAGLEQPNSGRIIVDGTVLSDNKKVTPPEYREMGMVFQSYAVWPHLTVWDNVAYGLRLKHIAKEEIKERVTRVLDQVGLSQYVQRYPTQLSGGQQQRVALARSLATEPSILLLDEPLSNLDAHLRETMRFEIRALQQRLGITAIYVTHSQDEALAVSDEVVVMSEGRIVQQGPPEEVYRRPRTRFVSGFIGLANVLEADLLGRETLYYNLKLANSARVKAGSADYKIDSNQKRVQLMIRPENIKLNLAGDQLNNLNQMIAKVENVSFMGSIVNYFIRLEGINESIRVQSTPPVIAHAGDTVTIAFLPDDCILLES